MENSSSALPDYSNPPVNEVVFGIQFKPLKNLKASHFGLLWDKFGIKKYPESKELPPVGHMIETFGEPLLKTKSITEHLDRLPLPRIFFINEIKNHLIQVQEDRFLQNWRKLKSDDEYPRYATLYPKFTKSLKTFGSFIKESNIGELEVDQYELTYVNHIPRGDGWVNLSDSEKIFPEFKCSAGDGFLPEPETAAWHKVYRLPNNTGRLYASFTFAISREKKDRIMILDLTARGYSDKMDEWFLTAHDWIVKGFADLTSQDTQKEIWKKK